MHQPTNHHPWCPTHFRQGAAAKYTLLQAKDVGCRSNFDPSRPLYAQDTSFSVKSSLTAVRQGAKVPSSDIFAPRCVPRANHGRVCADQSALRVHQTRATVQERGGTPYFSEAPRLSLKLYLVPLPHPTTDFDKENCKLSPIHNPRTRYPINIIRITLHTSDIPWYRSDRLYTADHLDPNLPVVIRCAGSA